MIFRMLVKKHQFMSSSHEGISVHMMKLWSTEEATAGFTSIHRVCPGPSSGLPTDGYEMHLGVGWNFWIVFCCFLIGLGLLISSDRI